MTMILIALPRVPHSGGGDFTRFHCEAVFKLLREPFRFKSTPFGIRREALAVQFRRGNRIIPGGAIGQDGDFHGMIVHQSSAIISTIGV